MQKNILGHILIGLALATMGTSVQAATQAAPTAAVKATVPQAPVVVRLGPALLEEYHGGAPAQRTTTYRDGESAEKREADKAAPKPQG